MIRLMQMMRQLGSGDGSPLPLHYFLPASLVRAAGKWLLGVAFLALGCGAIANDAMFPGDEGNEPPEAATADIVDEGPDPLTLYRTRSRSSVYFPRGSAEITESAMSTIAENAERLVAGTQQSVLLVGFTDDFSGSSEGSELAERRAAIVKDRLVGFGVPAERIDMTVNREDPEVVPCMTELCRLSYRRVRFVFMDARRSVKAARSNAR